MRQTAAFGNPLTSTDTPKSFSRKRTPKSAKALSPSRHGEAAVASGLWPDLFQNTIACFQNGFDWGWN
jgi:hypothetical protein